MIYFIGAGPGDPELITIKGARLLAASDVVIYTGSLVSPRILEYCRPGAAVHNSAAMTLEEVMATMRRAHTAGLTVARVHTGDPALYGAIQEQMDALDNEQIPYTVVPGVSSFLAAAAAIPHELTLPGVSQTVILTRLEGRTAVPEEEKLSALARHGATMCIFLSVGQMERLVAELLAGGYTPQTAAVVVERASWPEERVIRGTLADIAGRVKAAGITRTAQVLVGDVFAAPYQLSRLYDPQFAHSYRGCRE
ncbi:precorrin-4 C(11)-methyltransferase [Desulfotomaculum copahuensis]|uniref:Precorrin-4 C(11)-methyltransferase n=1 Tax=Desulfotomaculum copahuensis TaxID=1838280 RepID=A0A1B7LC02_9FIRM|nr:precorrin-4 C(11)-methyltransferase [Desulfotomaculum copahuensis]OAT80268.1 precorrin-4 C(11)-methyltransferase [Desulfotomaculum copahuensis]